MPYICLAQALDAGTVQVMDLQPNESNRGIYDPPGQTRYLTRVANEPVTRQTDGTLQQAQANGLSAYLFDRVEPGGLEQAALTVTCTGVQVADQVTIKGIVFTAVNGGAVYANRTFDMSGGDNATATDLAACVNFAANIVLVRIAPGQPAYQFNVYAAAAALANVVTFSATLGPAGTPQLGSEGDIAFVTSDNTRLLVTGSIAAVITRLSRANENWNTSIVAASAALIARVDAGQTLTLAAIDAVLATYGCELTNAAASRSVGTVDDILNIMSGRGYRIRRYQVRTAVLQQFCLATLPSRWSPACPFGAFTEPVTVYGTGMPNDTEVAPASIGGSTVFRENRGIRHTYDTGPFRVSVAEGQLATMMAAAGRPAITLYPDSDLSPHYPWTYQGALTFPAQVGVRLVTVYDDDGTLLTP